MSVSETNNFRQYQTIWLIRHAFQAMGEVASDYLADHGITSCERAFMEFLHPDAKLSVPRIAQKYAVSRQRMQVTANSLLQKQLIEQLDNPTHKRSPLYQLSPSGSGVFKKVLGIEKNLVKQLFWHISARDIEVTNKTLNHLLDAIKNGDVRYLLEDAPPVELKQAQS